MVTYSFRTIIFMQPIRRLHMHSKGPNFFSFGFWGTGRDYFLGWFFHVPNLFLKMFPIAIDFLGLKIKIKKNPSTN